MPVVVPGRRILLLGAVLVAVGALLPWVETQIGTFWGLQGAGRVTFYAGVVGLAGAVHRRALLVAAHAAVVAGAGLLFGGWQVLHMVEVCPGGGCGPGFGLLATLIGGVLAARAMWLAWRAHTGHGGAEAGDAPVRSGA